MSNETESILDLQIEVIQASIYCDIIKRLLLQHRSVSIVKVIVFSFYVKKAAVSTKKYLHRQES